MLLDFGCTGTLTRKVILNKTNLSSIPFKFKKKEFCSLEEQMLSFKRKFHFEKGFISSDEANRKSQNLFPFIEMVETMEVFAFT